MASQLEKETQLLEHYAKEFEGQLCDPRYEPEKRQLYWKQIELVRSQFPNEDAWKIHAANLYHHMALLLHVQQGKTVKERLEFIDKAISTYDAPRHRLLKGKICHEVGLYPQAMAEVEYICTNFPDSSLYIDARKLKDEIETTQTWFKNNPKGGGFCFIATAAYGSSLAPEVVLLSRFRDEVLLPSKLGALFVSFYYHVSPPLASLIARVDLLRSATRCLFLAPLLRLLKRP